MNTSFFTKSVMGVLMLAVLTLSACAKKDDSYGRTAERNGDGISPSGQMNTCGADQSKVWGKIYDPTNLGKNFETQVKAFVSATLDPNSLGTISGHISATTGVDFSGIFQFNSANQLVADSSSITIKIFDSYAKTTVNGQIVPPYEVSFTKAKSGTINRSTRQIHVIFEDEFGSITIDGTFNGQTVEGTVAFANYKAVSGYSPQSGNLGSFSSWECAMIVQVQ